MGYMCCNNVLHVKKAVMHMPLSWRLRTILAAAPTATHQGGDASIITVARLSDACQGTGVAGVVSILNGFICSCDVGRGDHVSRALTAWVNAAAVGDVGTAVGVDHAGSHPDAFGGLVHAIARLHL